MYIIGILSSLFLLGESERISNEKFHGSASGSGYGSFTSSSSMKYYDGKGGKKNHHGGNNHALKWIVEECSKEGHRSKEDRIDLQKCVNWALGVEHESFIIHRRAGHKEEYVVNTGTIAMQLSRHGRAFGIDRQTHTIAVNLDHTGVEFSGRECSGINEINFKAMAESVSMDHKQLSYDEAFCHIETIDKYIIDVVSASPGEMAISKELGTIERPRTGMSSELGIYTRTGGKTHKCSTCDGCDLKDYTGSYHVTLSLPFDSDGFIVYDESVLENGKCSKSYVKPSNTSTVIDTWVSAHENFANQFQWVEPLLLAVFGSSDSEAVCDDGSFVEGSYRMMSSGWGTLGTTDVRTFGDHGTGRYTHDGFQWLLDSCSDKDAGIFNCVDQGMGSDIRTITEIDEHALPMNSEIPAMSVGQGVEFRIFDNFPSRHFPQVLRLISLIAENSRTHVSTEFVYENVDWASSAKLAMVEGHNSLLSDRYITDLEEQLDIDLSGLGKNVMAFSVFKEVYEQLWEKNIDGFWTKLFLEDIPSEMPELSNPNRESWEIGAENMGYGVEQVLDLFNGVTIVADLVMGNCTSEDHEDFVYLADSYGLVSSMEFNEDGSVYSFSLVENVETVDFDLNVCHI